MQRRQLTILMLSVLILGLALPARVVAGDKEESAQSSMTMSLPRTYRLTLSLAEKGQTYDFSMSVASRQFSMNLGDKDIALRGRLWNAESGNLLLDFTLEFTQWVETEGRGKQRRGSTWNGSTHLEAGKPVEIATFLDGSFSLRLDKKD